MSTVLVCIACLAASAHNDEGQKEAESVVREFFYNVSEWFQCEKNAYTFAGGGYRKKAIDLTIGENRCKVDDRVTELTGMSEGFVADWFTFFYKERVVTGCSLTINSIRYECEEPRITTVGGGSWVYADVTIRYDNTSVRINDYFRVFNGKINRIIAKDDRELSTAIKLYNDKRYDEAFPIFLKISEQKPYDFEAQYYAVVMLTLKQGCKHLSKDTRIDYAVKYSYNGYKENNRPLAELYLKYYYTKEP